MPTWLAGAVLFFTSGSVLVLEILAGRLLAPYLGVRLEVYTAIIGTVLAGISVGTWLGGRLADRIGSPSDARPVTGGRRRPGHALPARRAGRRQPRRGHRRHHHPALHDRLLRSRGCAQRREPDGGEAATAGPGGDGAGGGAPVRPGHRGGHRRHLRGRVRPGGRRRHQHGHSRRGWRPGRRRPPAVGRSGPAPALGDHAGADLHHRGGDRGAGVGGGRPLRRGDPLPLCPGHPRPHPHGGTGPVARHPPPQLRRPRRSGPPGTALHEGVRRRHHHRRPGGRR